MIRRWRTRWYMGDKLNIRHQQRIGVRKKPGGSRMGPSFVSTDCNEKRKCRTWHVLPKGQGKRIITKHLVHMWRPKYHGTTESVQIHLKLMCYGIFLVEVWEMDSKFVTWRKTTLKGSEMTNIYGWKAQICLELLCYDQNHGKLLQRAAKAQNKRFRRFEIP